MDKGIQRIMSAWVSNGLSMWSNCAEAIKAFGVVKGGPGMKNCRGSSQDRSLDCIKHVVIHSEGETSLASPIKLSKPTTTMQKTDLRVYELFSHKKFSSAAVRKRGWHVRSCRERTREERGAHPYVALVPPTHPMSSAGVLVSKKNHSRASRSSKKGKAALGNDLQASGEEKDSQRGSCLIPAIMKVRKSFYRMDEAPGLAHGRKAIEGY